MKLVPTNENTDFLVKLNVQTQTKQTLKKIKTKNIKHYGRSNGISQRVGNKQ